MFVGAATPLTQSGLTALAGELDIPLPALWAVLAVETSGCGFLPDRRPLILFERHWFSRLTKRQFDASNPDISNAVAGGYGPRGAAQFDRLARAVALDRTAALRSTSWGLGQVMGFNASDVGFPTVEALVHACVASEDGQMQAMGGYIKSHGLAVRLRNKDWAGFAFRYNGTEFQKNKYDTKLATYNARFEVGPLPDLSVRWVQMVLSFLGFSSGGVDGWFGGQTQRALMAYQKANSLPITGTPDDATMTALQAALSTLPID